MTDPLFIVVDLFCGAGGTTTGFALAELEGSGIAKVVACVNHDPKAIKSHWLNHPEVTHYEEDIRTLDLTALVALVKEYRRMYPNAYLILWASLECTNFSKAKGGQPRDADSRTLADHLPRYIKAIDPDYVQIENVVEFMSWGPLDENGKPISRKNGEDWMRWRSDICKLGYQDEWKELNSANYGAYTSRNRLFGAFAKDGLPITWPGATHAKVKAKGHALFATGLSPWKPVKDVLDFADEGESIFTRDKPLSDKTLERILAGLHKYVAKGDTSFISKYYSGRPNGKVNSVNDPSSTVTTVANLALVQSVGFTAQSVEQPAGTITTVDHHSLVKAAFIQQRNTGEPESKLVDVNGPARTITATGGNQDLVQAKFLTIYNGKSLCRSVTEPAPVIACNDRLSLVQPEYFIDKHYGSNPQNQSIDQPAGTVVTNDKHRLVQCIPFIMPTNFDNKPTSIDQPSPTITANRKHHYLVQAESGELAIAILEGDSQVMIAIKQFMAAYGIVDIKMRMLRVHELLAIQGFPADYKLVGNQADQKKFIGNSVVPQVVKAWTEAMASKLIDNQNKKVA
ncbi:DNA cytosine methyltransferase [Paraflavitalea speifideaquila]|uniref:DNA cytosine methyltransferase n=1 Tax=Paraflavitalea speifideaquila TaxID=3076558 RepID=UPI0028E5D5FC|nr:DNA cytosine methyltransferase [Paraflavitalea speifideiaquila]